MVTLAKFHPVQHRQAVAQLKREEDRQEARSMYIATPTPIRKTPVILDTIMWRFMRRS
jgi:hypothetical protein